MLGINTDPEIASEDFEEEEIPAAARAQQPTVQIEGASVHVEMSRSTVTQELASLSISSRNENENPKSGEGLSVSQTRITTTETTILVDMSARNDSTTPNTSSFRDSGIAMDEDEVGTTKFSLASQTRICGLNDRLEKESYIKEVQAFARSGNIGSTSTPAKSAGWLPPAFLEKRLMVTKLPNIIKERYRRQKAMRYFHLNHTPCNWEPWAIDPTDVWLFQQQQIKMLQSALYELLEHEKCGNQPCGHTNRTRDEDPGKAEVFNCAVEDMEEEAAEDMWYPTLEEALANKDMDWKPVDKNGVRG